MADNDYRRAGAGGDRRRILIDRNGMFSLQMDGNLATTYASRAQQSRVITESWAASNLYCAACSSNSLNKCVANMPAIDFTCDSCGVGYQLKSMSRWNERRVVDGAYSTLVAAIREDRTPNLFLLGYSASWQVTQLTLIPSFFFSEAAVQARKPLSATARRAGWVGCNILLAAIAPVGKLRIVSNNIASDCADVRAQYANLAPVQTLPPTARGWTLDVLRIVQQFPDVCFTLADVYAHERALTALHPQNRNIRPKIRQQLQVLRDLGLIAFQGRGRYKLSLRNGNN